MFLQIFISYKEGSNHERNRKG